MPLETEKGAKVDYYGPRYWERICLEYLSLALGTGGPRGPLAERPHLFLFGFCPFNYWL